MCRRKHRVQYPPFSVREAMDHGYRPAGSARSRHQWLSRVFNARNYQGVGNFRARLLRTRVSPKYSTLEKRQMQEDAQYIRQQWATVWHLRVRR